MTLLHLAARNKTAILAGVLTAGETLVNMGVPLPGQQHIPERFRFALIGLLVAAAFYYRWKATRGRGGC